MFLFKTIIYVLYFLAIQIWFVWLDQCKKFWQFLITSFGEKNYGFYNGLHAPKNTESVMELCCNAIRQSV